MSYPWANNLVYRITGSEAPKPEVQADAAAAERGDAAKAADVSFAGIDAAWSRAEAQVAGLEKHRLARARELQARRWCSPSIQATAAGPISAPNSL